MIDLELFRARLARRLPTLVESAPGKPIIWSGDALDKLTLAAKLRDLAAQLEREAIGEIDYDAMGATKRVA